MAWTQADIDTLKSAIATGARRVRYADGREAEYRTLAEMRETLGLIQAEVAGAAGAAAPRKVSYASFRNGAR